MVDVKSASCSLEWTTPNVPKPLNENMDGAESAVLSAEYARAAYDAITIAMKAKTIWPKGLYRTPPMELAEWPLLVTSHQPRAGLIVGLGGRYHSSCHSSP